MTKTVSFHGHEAESLRMFNEKIDAWQKIPPSGYPYVESVSDFARFLIYRHQVRFYENSKEETIKIFMMELLLHYNVRCNYFDSNLAIGLLFDFLEADRAGNLKKEGLPLCTKENRNLQVKLKDLATVISVYPKDFKAEHELLRRNLFDTLSLWKVLNKKPKFNTESFTTKFLETLNAE
jgi:hypothetical protein